MKRWTRSIIRHKVTVHTLEATFEGILKEECQDGLVLVNTLLIRAEGAPLELSGETFLPRDQITMIQKLS